MYNFRKIIKNRIFSNKYTRQFRRNLSLPPEKKGNQVCLMELRYLCHQLEKTIKHDFDSNSPRGKDKFDKAIRIIESFKDTRFEKSQDVLWAGDIIKKYKKWVLGERKNFVVKPNSEKQIKQFTDLKEIIYNRRSVRFWANIRIPRQTINDILEMGTMAPSSCNRQPWKFVVVENTRPGVGKNPSNKKMIECAPFIIYVAIDRRMHPEKHAPFIDAGLVTQNILLAIEYYGLKACGMYQCEMVKQKRLRKLLDFSPNDYICVAIPFGSPLEVSTAPARISVDKITKYKKLDTRIIISTM